MLRYIENWKLCDYLYCPQIVNTLISQSISIQEPLDTLTKHLKGVLDDKEAETILHIVENHAQTIQACYGIHGNSLYVLLNYGLSRSLIKEHIFEKVDLESLLFMSLEQIMKALDVSMYSGHKILEASRFVLHACVDDDDSRKKEILIEDIREYFRGKQEVVSLEQLEQDLLFRSGSELLQRCLSTLILQSEIEEVEKGIYKNKNIKVHRSLSTILDSIQDEVSKQIVVRHLYQESWEDIISSLDGCDSIDQVQTIFQQEMDSFPYVKEDKYFELISKYDLDKEAFYAITTAQEPTWGYILERYKNQLNEEKIPLSGSVLSRLVMKELCVSTKKLLQYLDKHYLHLYGSWVSKEDRNELLEAVCKSFDGYFQKSDVEKRFNKILNQYLPEKASHWFLEEFRVQMGLRQGYLVHSVKKGMRYRIVNKDLVCSILEEVDIHQYQDTIVSTKKIFEENIGIMEKYDIRDQYELHSIFRTGKEKHHIQDGGMEILRMPMLQFGKGQEDSIVKEALMKFAPIDVDAFVRIMARQYGYDIGSFTSYIRKKFKVYIDENRIEIADNSILESQDYQQLSQLLHQDFYFIKEVERLIKEYKLTDKLLDPYVLKRLGYKSYTGYILKDNLLAGKYFEQWILENYKTMDDSHLEIDTLRHALSRLEERNEIFEMEKNCYGTIHEVGMSQEQLAQWMGSILSQIEKGQYFTEYSLYQDKIVDKVYSNTFFKSLWKGNPNVQMSLFGQTWVFQKSNDKKFSEKEFLVQLILQNPGMNISGCMAYLKSQYNIYITKKTLQEKIIECGLYYSMDTEKIYLEKRDASFRQETLF